MLICADRSFASLAYSLLARANKSTSLPRSVQNRRCAVGITPEA